MQFDNILFPVDFSEQCLQVSRAVNAMAHAFNSRITLLNVLTLPPQFYDSSDRSMVYGEVTLEDIRKSCEERLQSFRARYFDGLDVSAIQVEGEPADMIRHYAETNPIDLIMMPTHGEGPFRLALLGSVTAKVLHDVKCPVWTSCHSESPITDPFRFTSLICAVDETEDSIPIMKAAASLSVRFTAKLVLVHALCSPTWVDSGATLPSSLEAREAHVRAQLTSLQQRAGIAVPMCINSGHLEDVVAEAARKYRANLTVIGRGHHSDDKSMFRSRVFWIVRESPCPVLSI